MKIFVYGTLRRHYNNNILLRDSEFLGYAKTEPKYSLAVSVIPYLIKGEDSVIGEVYEVDDDVLKDLDSLEGHPTVYTRKELKVFFNEELIEVQAYHWLHNDKEGFYRTDDYTKAIGR